MSDYIYGSSLRAAKSKANYLFEGDFRRRPNQNLSGASRSVARVDLLQQAAEQRQNREDTRRRENASLKIQSVWRGYRSRRLFASHLRGKFDAQIANIYQQQPNQNKTGNVMNFDVQDYNSLSGQLIIFFHSGQDEPRLESLINIMMQNPKVIMRSREQNPSLWLHRLSRLLTINLNLIDKRKSTPTMQAILKYLDFYERFTRMVTVLNEQEASIIWTKLIECRLYSILRCLLDNSTTEDCHTHYEDLVLELISRSLDFEPIVSQSSRVMPVYIFFEQFLREAQACSTSAEKKPRRNQNTSPSIIEHDYLYIMIELKPKQMQPKYILDAFKSSINESSAPVPEVSVSRLDQNQVNECRRIAWLCRTFVKSLYNRIDNLSDMEKVNYINIISHLIKPSEYITNISLMQAANEESDDLDEDMYNLSCSMMAQRLANYYHEVHVIIKETIGLINEKDHINSLKSIIFNDDYHQQVQQAIAKICNLMLARERLAIFNCRLLYTVAFSKEFSRSLWRSILATTSNSIYGANVPVYVEISRGSQSISDDSWRSVLPKLRLFCSLSSYLLPTLGDDEFYTSNHENNPLYAADENVNLNSSRDSKNKTTTTTSTAAPAAAAAPTDPTAEPSGSMSSFYVDKELTGISAILRDMCVGFVEIIYQGDCHSMLSSSSPSTSSSSVRYDNFGRIVGIGSIAANAKPRDCMGVKNQAEEHARLISFEIRSSFQALVRLVCQLHARDSRKQFCPDGHWICPSVVIPANKAVDFQLVSSQQGRILFQLNRQTHDQQAAATSTKQPSDRLANLSSECKTVLILQEIPFVISFHDRVLIFQQLLRKEHQIHQAVGYHFGLPGTAIQVQIRRNYLYEDAFEKLSNENEPNMKLPLQVSLINVHGADEAGIDGGGLTKEFLGELLKAGFDPMRGFFAYTKDHFLYPNPSANVLFASLPGGFEVHYEFLGRILGKAIFEKIMVELPMASFFLAKLLADKHSSDVDLHNLESLDPVLYKNLVYLKNYKGDVADLNLDFTISNNELGEHEMVELKPGGSKIPVTRENKIEYVHLVADYRLNKQIRLQCAAFKRGLAQLVDLDWLRMFDPRELQILISGAPTLIDVQDWRYHTIYCTGYSEASGPIKAFWAAVSQLDESAKRKLLKFATSCSLPPLLGFKDLVPQFAIAPAEEERLPTASTCMNLLKLPKIEDVQTMRSKLLYAIESNAGFELS